ELRRLVRFVAERCRRGHDHLRRIERLHVVSALTLLCNHSTCHCLDHVKHIARWCRDGAAKPVISSEQITAEVGDATFEDEVIRPGAARRSSGDVYGDWCASLNELREAYLRHYLPVVTQRLRQPDQPAHPSAPG